MRDEKAVIELIEEAVHKGATTVEDVHREIANLPITVLEQLGLFEKTMSEVRRVQDVSIGAIYDVIRDVNHQIAKLAGEFVHEGGQAAESARDNA